MVRTVQVPGDQIQVHIDIGPGRIISATLTVDDSPTAEPAPIDPNNRPYEEWLKDFEAMCALAPVNQYPCDDSREAIYGPDAGE